MLLKNKGVKIRSRMNRMQYIGLYSFLLFMTYMIQIAKDVTPLPKLYLEITSAALYIIVVISMIVVTIKRLHDINWSGWWFPLIRIPLISIFFNFYLCLKPGTDGDNKFGKPKATTPFLYKIMAILCPVLLIAASTWHYMENRKWTTFSAREFSIQFPDNTYKLKYNNLYGIPFTKANYETHTVSFAVYMLNYKNARHEEMQYLIKAMKLEHSLLELVNTPSKAAIKPLLLNESTGKNLQLLRDESIHQESIPGRLLQGQFQDNTGQNTYVSSRIFVDDANKKYYFMIAYYPNKNSTEKVDHFMDSFTIKKKTAG